MALPVHCRRLAAVSVVLLADVSGGTWGVARNFCILDVYKRQPLSIPVDAADKAHGQTAYDSEDISGGMGLLTPEGPAVEMCIRDRVAGVFQVRTLVEVTLERAA